MITIMQFRIVSSRNTKLLFVLFKCRFHFFKILRGLIDNVQLKVMLFRPKILLNLLLIFNNLQCAVKYIRLIQQVKICGFNRNLVFCDSFNITLFHIKSVNIRFQHADIFHNECFWFEFENSPDILFYQHIILTDSMVLLAIRIRKALTGRAADDHVYIPIFFLNFVIICSADISLYFNAWMIQAICFLHIRTVLKRYLDIIFSRLHKAEAQASCSCKQVHNFVHNTFLFLLLKVKTLG